MRCPECGTDMVFVGFFQRGLVPSEDSVNWYCENCNNVYFKFIKDTLDIGRDL